MKCYLFVLAPAFILFGCSGGGESELKLPIPDGLSSEVRSIVEVGWPKVRAACPGLDKYASDLEFIEISDNFSYASSKSAERVEVVFHVKNEPSSIPSGYTANGNNCFFGISRDGKQLSVPKHACASLCEDQDIDESNYKKAL